MQERCKSKLIISLLHGCPFRLPSHVFPAPCPALPGDGLPEGSRSQPTPLGPPPPTPRGAAGGAGNNGWEPPRCLGRPGPGVRAGGDCAHPWGRGGIRAPYGCNPAGAGEGSEQVTRRLLRARLLELLRGSSPHSSH